MEPIKCKCSNCGIDFITHKGRIRTLCNKCSTKGPDTKEAICKNCGKTFLLYRNPNDENNFEKKVLCPECRPTTIKLDSGKYIRHCSICGELTNSSNDCICEKCRQELLIQKIYYQDDIKGVFTKIVDGHYYSKCSKCNCEIEVDPKNKNRPIGKFRKLCDKCHEEFMKETKEYQCKDCGKTLIASRSTTDGGFLVRDFCQECYEKRYPRKYNPPKFKLRICECCKRTYRQYPNSDGSFTENKKYCPDCSFDNPIIKARHSTTAMKKYGVKWSCLSQTCQDAREQVSPSSSKINQKFADLLDKHNIKYEQEYLIEQNGYRRHYDFYIPSKDCLIEVNPTYTHNAIGNAFSGYDSSPKKKEYRRWYHLNRTQDIDKRLIHVWDWDNWDLIINMIKPKTTFYAKQLKLGEVTEAVAKTFLNNYHLQGNCRNKDVKIGLYDSNNNLIQIMVFGKPRYNKQYEWELLRLCTQSDYIVVGGANKIFKYFVNNYNPKSVLSYCDYSKFNGDVYEKLGFKFYKLTYPSKIWSKGQNHITDNLLRQRGFDQLVGSKLDPPEIYGKGTDNEQLMLEHGWLPVFDCGQKVYIWKPDTENVLSNDINK